jgi:hypothetical protein
MRDDFPGISTRDPNRYRAMWRDENREHVRAYNRIYARKRRSAAKIAAKRKNGRKKARA